jgi:hydrophobic/amphiphilic exporter-1 (mainly G- bacteria), HAE1 family
MSLPRFSVRRPVLTTMVTLIVVTLGTVSLGRLQIDLLPNIELPTATVRTSYEGASPEVMEQLVTQIIEEIVATAPNVEEITSESSEGQSRVRVSFAWGTDIDAAALDLQARLDDEVSELPEDVVRPRVSKFDVNSFPVVLLGISSELDPVDLTSLIEEQIRYRFSRVPGVAQVDLWGGYTREARVELDRAQLQALGLPLDQVVAALRDANLDLPAGTIERGRYEVTLRAPAQFENAQQIRETVVAVRDGAPITIGQIATVVDSYSKLTRIVRINGRPGVRVALRKQSDANTVEVSRAVLAEIAAVNRAFPQIAVVAVINQGNFIERSIDNVSRSVAYGGLLAIAVLALFLRNVRSTFVIGLAIPISLVATFALAFAGGLTINLMTLGGLALGVGMMVDNSIVVLENIFRRRDEQGEDPETCAVEGASEVASAIVASTITTLVIFLPLIFMRGVSGMLFGDLAFVIVFALVCSLVVSLSLVPMLASKLIRPRRAAPQLPRRSSARFSLAALYARALRWALAHRWPTVLGSAALLALSLLLVPLIGTELIPPSDEGEVAVTGEMDVGTRLALVDVQTRRIEAIVEAAVPEARASVVSVQEGEGELRLSLSSALERERSNVEIAADLRTRLSDEVPGMIIRTRAPQGQFLLDRVLGGSEGLSVEVRGFELETIQELARRAAKVVERIPGITDVDLSHDQGTPQDELRIDRDRAAALGLSVRDVATALEVAVAGRQAGEFRPGGQSYRIFVQLKDAERLTLDEVLDFRITAPSGAQVALRDVVTSRSGRGPTVIERKDQQRVVRVTANVAGRDQGSVAAEVAQALEGIARPAGYDLTVAGSYEEQQKASRELTTSILLALLLVYMVLASQYESLRDPLVVMLSVPVAAIGVLLTLWATGSTLNIQSYIGCIMLGGIAVNNAILIVDQAARLHRESGDVRRAVQEAGRRRLRPILMTTSTTVLGLLPLAFGLGEGADAQAPLARAVVGGMIASTLITLLLIPAVYSLAHRDRAAGAREHAEERAA